MQLIQLQSVASQTLTVTLAQQLTRLNVYQNDYGLFVDVLVREQLIIAGVLAENLNRIVRYTYLGFVGDIIFADAQGTSDPNYLGLGAGNRFECLYLSAVDLTGLGLSG